MHSNSFVQIAIGSSILLAACAGPDPMTGTWRQSAATTQLPAELGGGDLAVDATFTFDGDMSTFDMHLDLALSELGLTDVVDARGTYEETSSGLALSFDGFTIDPESGNTARVAEDGSQCIVLMGFGGGEVCFPVPQTNVQMLEGETLTMTIDQAIAPAGVTQTHLVLARVE